MHNLNDLNNYLLSIAKRKEDINGILDFTKYCVSSCIDKTQVKDFDAFEFLKFHAHLKLALMSVKMIYKKMAAIRRLMATAHSNGYEFKLNPLYFEVPPKPTIEHFEPLSDENSSALNSFNKDEIEKIYNREFTFQNALAKGEPIRERGSSFKKTDIYTPSVSFYKWQVSLNDFLFQLYQEHPKYPNNITKEERSKGGEYASMSSIDYDKMETAFKTIFKRIGIQRIANVLPFIKDAPHLRFIDCIGYLYPRFFEAHVISWAIGLETG